MAVLLENYREAISQLGGRLGSYAASVDQNAVQGAIDEIEAQSSQLEFWLQPEKAHAVMQRLAQLKESLREIQDLQRQLRDLNEVYDLALAEQDQSLSEEIERELRQLQGRMDGIELTRLLSGPHDRAHALLNITAGAGGTDAQDWAQMLLRMYLRWIERRGFAAEELDCSYGEEAGIKSVALRVTGPYAYGYLACETGVHRLVRISPFNANSKRQTSFAAVDVIPELEQDMALKIKPEDLRIDTFRASGPGGQHVNKTDSAVRITHLPTHIVVQSQNRRSQLANKEAAMVVLQSRLLQLMESQKKQELDQLRGAQTDIAWGNQIRNYVFHPYKLVKDTRTELETSDVAGVMDGKLDEFIQAYLKRQRAV